MPVIALILLIAAVMGGGASIAAQNALPGDMLWSFKVNVNERIEAVLAPGSKAQAYFDMAAIEARLKEADTLAAGSRLTADAQAQLKASLDAYEANVQQQIAALEAKNDYYTAADVAARFQGIIASHVSGPLDLRATLDAANKLSADASAKAALY